MLDKNAPVISSGAFLRLSYEILLYLAYMGKKFVGFERILSLSYRVDDIWMVTWWWPF